MTKKIDSLGVKTLRLDDNMRIENTFAVQGEDLRGLKITFVTNKGEVVKDEEIEVRWTFQVESEGEIYTLTEPVIAERVEEGGRYFYIIRYPAAVTHFAGIGQAQLAVYKKRKKLLSKPYNLRVYKNVSYIPKDIVELEGQTERLQALINRAEDRDVETLKIQEESRVLNKEQRKAIDDYQVEFDELLEKQEVSGEELISLYTQKHEELMSKLTDEQSDLFSIYEDKHSEVLKETNQINLNSKELQETLEALRKDLELKIATYLENLDAVKEATEESKIATSESIKQTKKQKEETVKSQKATEESVAATEKAAETTQRALSVIEDSIETTKRARELNEKSESLIESHEITIATGEELILQGEALSQVATELIAKMEADLEKSDELKELLSTGQEMISQGTAMISRGEEVLSQAEKVITEVANAIEIGVDEKVQQVIEDKIKLLSVSYTQLENKPKLNGVELVGDTSYDTLWTRGLKDIIESKVFNIRGGRTVYHGYERNMLWDAHERFEVTHSDNVYQGHLNSIFGGSYGQSVFYGISPENPFFIDIELNRSYELSSSARVDWYSYSWRPKHFKITIRYSDNTTDVFEETNYSLGAYYSPNFSSGRITGLRFEVFETTRKEKDGTYNLQLSNIFLIGLPDAGTYNGLFDNYKKLRNKPKINGVELVGDKTTDELGIKMPKQFTDMEVGWLQSGKLDSFTWTNDDGYSYKIGKRGFEAKGKEDELTINMNNDNFTVMFGETSGLTLTSTNRFVGLLAKGNLALFDGDDFTINQRPVLGAIDYNRSQIEDSQDKIKALEERSGTVRDTKSNRMMEMWIGTQEEYDALGSYSDYIVYVIKEG